MPGLPPLRAPRSAAETLLRECCPTWCFSTGSSRDSRGDVCERLRASAHRGYPDHHADRRTQEADKVAALDAGWTTTSPSLSPPRAVRAHQAVMRRCDPSLNDDVVNIRPAGDQSCTGELRGHDIDLATSSSACCISSYRR